jgi:BASS family bile acid:Na+ symporter
MTDNLFSHYLMPIAIAFIMFGIGINLRFVDFKQTFNRPKAVITGLAAQMLLLPIIAFIINIFFDIDPIYKVGFVLIAACPGGTTSNLVTLFLRGRLALSVSLTAFNSFLILFTIPLITNLALYLYEGLEANIEMPVLETIGNMLITVLLPTLIGMLYRHYFPGIVHRTEKIINISMSLFLLFVFIGIFAFENVGTAKLSSYMYLFYPAILLNFVSMFAGYLLALITKIRNRGRFTIAIQVGLQNSALAIYVASKLLNQPEIAVVAIIYSSFSLFTTAFWAYIMKKYL